MIRPLTLLSMILAAVSGAYMFAVKHRAQVLDDQLASVAQQTRLDQERIRVLQAQWALETAPPRVKQLAAQFTDLQPVKPAQMVTLAALSSILPPPSKVAPEPPLLAVPPPAVVASTTPLPAVAAPAQPPSKSVSPPAPTPTTAPALAAASSPAAPKSNAPAKLASVVPHHAAIQPHQLSLTTHPHVPPHVASTQLADNVVPRPVHSFYVAPPPAYHSASPPVYHSAPPSGGDVSALAMAADLPPPRPLSGNGSNN
ncbi:MAG: hypothetical protein POG74_04710 [Acidocella sp.]|nr:hypothetical protein [Acidocella sp.]